MADLVYTDPHEIAPYTELFDRLRCAALSIPDSIDFLAKAADQVDSYKKEEK